MIGKYARSMALLVSALALLCSGCADTDPISGGGATLSVTTDTVNNAGYECVWTGVFSIFMRPAAPTASSFSEPLRIRTPLGGDEGVSDSIRIDLDTTAPCNSSGFCIDSVTFARRGAGTCTSDDQCPPDGVCFNDFVTPCEDDTDCPGSSCLQNFNFPAVCQRMATTASLPADPLAAGDYLVDRLTVGPSFQLYDADADDGCYCNERDDILFDPPLVVSIREGGGTSLKVTADVAGLRANASPCCVVQFGGAEAFFSVTVE